MVAAREMKLTKPVAWDPSLAQALDIAGVKLEGRCFGAAPAVADTIVLLHEGLGCVELWRDFPQRLAQETGYGVFAYNRQGYGDSTPARLPRPLDYMTREAVDVLPLVLDQIGFKRGILLGHSDGASIAALHAGKIRDPRVYGLILMAPHFFTEPEGLASISAARTAYDSGDLRPRLAKYHANVDNTFRGWNDAWLDPGFVKWNIEDAIASINVPVLAIQGHNDQYGSIAQIDALKHGLQTSFQPVMIDDCGHSPFAEKPRETVSAISEFVAALPNTRQAPAGGDYLD